MEMKNQTPSKSKTNIVNKVLNPVNCDSPIRFLPNMSTPPSRFARILNPFEQHIIDRLHLPTFSPSVFAQVSTPKTDEKFKWTIDDISRVKPADIDENTISQHVIEHDPTMESRVQEKIDKFFNEKVIVPSPFNEQIKQMPLITSPVSITSHTSTQTVLSLPPILPKHLEEALAPYFSYTSDQQKHNSSNTSLYKKLFEFEEEEEDNMSRVSSPPPSTTSLSPLQFSPDFNNQLESTMEKPELRDCSLSPIGRSPQSRSVCRLSFSQHMSVDASMVVPDVDKSLNCTNLETNNSFQPLEQLLEQSSTNWDMEYNKVSILSRSPVSSPDPEMSSNSNSNTPHSRIFTSQRKRLSDSFKSEDVDMEDEPKRVRNKIDDFADTGYHTGGATLCEISSVHMFASTPTKIK